MTNAKPTHDPIVTNGEIVCSMPGETQALGARFATALARGAVISLEGTLGAGKTQFVKGFVAALGYSGDVSSPTFSLVHEYDAPAGIVAHFDWYRLETAAEVVGLGWDDYLAGDETLLVEWGDRFPELLPPGAWRVRFEIRDASREVRWESAA
jgi:tRNA threonylcarbamoyladenosine biosynthesis protein TsaE